LRKEYLRCLSSIGIYLFKIVSLEEAKTIADEVFKEKYGLDRNVKQSSQERANIDPREMIKKMDSMRLGAS